jgi:EmrB/QacA subfamily drug resistance transporter
MARTYDPETIHRRRWAALAVLCLSLVLVVAANSSLNVALPTLVREMGATHADLQWIVDAYALVFAGLLLAMGAIGDRYGRKGMLQAGLVTFALASLAGTLATEPWHLVTVRSVMGVGAAMIMPATLSIVTNVFPPHERARAIAIWAGLAGAGASIGPVSSGALLEHFWFGSVFFVNVPIVVVALAAGAFLVPTSRDRGQRPLDPLGSVLSTTALAALLYAIIQGPEHGWTDPVILGAFAVGLAVAASFVAYERRIAHPMLPMELFGDRRFSVGAGAISLVFFAMFGVFFVITQYLQFVLDYSPLGAGLAGLPMAAAMVVLAPRSAFLAQRFGRDRVMAAGLVLAAAGLLGISQLSPATVYAEMVPILVLLGAGMSLTMAPATGSIMEAVPLDKAGVGSAVNDTTRELGGSLGVAVLGSILASGYRSSLDPALAQAPSQVADAARESVGAALAIAEQAPAPFGDLLAASARAAFADAMGLVFVIAAVVVLANAAMVLRWMPSRRGVPVAPEGPPHLWRPGERGEGEPEPLASHGEG